MKTIRNIRWINNPTQGNVKSFLAIRSSKHGAEQADENTFVG